MYGFFKAVCLFGGLDAADHEEFVASEPDADHVVREIRFDRARCDPYSGVAVHVPEDVVDLLHQVDVDKHDHEHRVSADAVFIDRDRLVLVAESVVKTGHRVDLGDLPQAVIEDPELDVGSLDPQGKHELFEICVEV